MMRRLLSTAVAIMLVNLGLVGVASATPASDAAKAAALAEKVRSGIAKLGTGPAAQVKVKLADGRKLKGYLSEVSDTGFVVRDASGQTTPVAYPQVKQVKGHNLSTRTKIYIGVGIAIILLLIAGPPEHA